MTNSMIEHPSDDNPSVQHASAVLSALIAELTRLSACNILRLMQREDLSMPRVVTLLQLQRLGAASISDISAHLNLSLGTTSHLVEQLVAGGFVSRGEDPADRRHKQVALTERGAAFVVE